MADFNPSPHDRVAIGGLSYQVMPHPAVPSFAFGQEGRKAFVYQVAGGPDGGLYALKEFKQAYRLPELVEICDQLARFAGWPGLEVCNRVCLHNRKHSDAISRYPDLEYAVLMPWIGGSTWYDMVIGMTPLSQQEAVGYANAAAQVLAALEEAGLAHCDISAANVIINPNTERAHLIDVEDLYAPGFTPPAALPAGTDGYAHRTAAAGLWGPESDRFSGAVLISEMAAWFDPRIRKEAEEEHYFSTAEMHQDSPRYQLMREVLGGLDARLAGLLDAMWFSDSLADCPPLSAWQEVISEVNHRVRVAGVVSDWKPLTIPGAAPAAEPAAQVEPPAPAVPDAAAPDAAAPAPVRAEAEPPAQEAEPDIPRPTVPLIQAVQPNPAPPNVPAAPVQVQPSPGVGGPVVEWRPLTLPAADARTGDSVAPAGNRPIWSPPAEPAPAPEAAPETPAEQDTRPNAPLAGVPAELEAAADGYPPYDDAGAQPYAPPEPSGEDVAPEEAPDAEAPAPAAESEADYENRVEPTGYEEDAYTEPEYADEIGWPDEGYDDGGEVEPAAAPPASDEGAARAAGLLRPILDLTHIDERNRPHLVWTESGGADHYTVEEDDRPDFSSAKAYRVRRGDTRWSPQGLLWRRSGRLYYRVRAENDRTAGPWSEVLQVRIGRG